MMWLKCLTRLKMIINKHNFMVLDCINLCDYKMYSKKIEILNSYKCLSSFINKC